jgi:formate hydrogenlyase subunit 3/multisubunit Na+/H+ antiporter MnhD subunit
MSLDVVIEGMTIAAFLILLAGGKQRREQGWTVLCILVAIAAGLQAASMSLVVSLEISLRITLAAPSSPRITLYTGTDTFLPGISLR